MILADNELAWYLLGASDRRCNDDYLHALGKINGADFEVVDTLRACGLASEPSGPRLPRTGGETRSPLESTMRTWATSRSLRSQWRSWSSSA